MKSLRRDRHCPAEDVLSRPLGWPGGFSVVWISMTEELPDLEIGELVYAENIGAYAGASSTYFNGFPPAKIVHVNQDAAVIG